MLLLDSETDAVVRKALGKRVAWPFHETLLSEAVARIAADLGVDVHLDRGAFDEAGIDVNTVRLSAPFAYSDAYDAIQRTLRPKKLHSCIRNGAIMIYPENEEWHGKLALYNVTDLVENGKATADGLSEAIQTTIEPKTWEDAGGPGSIAFIQIRDGQTILAVSQVYHVLREVEQRLDGLRRK